LANIISATDAFSHFEKFLNANVYIMMVRNHERAIIEAIFCKCGEQKTLNVFVSTEKEQIIMANTHKQIQSQTK